MPGHTGGREVRSLMARHTAERGRALVVESADHQRSVRMLVLSLTRPVAGRMAIEAPWVLKHPAGLDEERARAVGLIANQREGLGGTQVVRAGQGGSGARQNDHGKTCLGDAHRTALLPDVVGYPKLTYWIDTVNRSIAAWWLVDVLTDNVNTRRNAKDWRCT